MHTRNKVFLVKPDSIKGWVISLVTFTPFSHAVLEIDGIRYDASESRGNFSHSNIDLNNREVVEIEFDGELSSWLKDNLGRKYDWKGVLGWIFNSTGDRNKFYCFEAVISALRYVDIKGPNRKKVTGVDILADLAKSK